MSRVKVALGFAISRQYHHTAEHPSRGDLLIALAASRPRLVTGATFAYPLPGAAGCLRDSPRVGCPAAPEEPTPGSAAPSRRSSSPGRRRRAGGLRGGWARWGQSISSSRGCKADRRLTSAPLPSVASVPRDRVRVTLLSTLARRAGGESWGMRRFFGCRRDLRLAAAGTRPRAPRGAGADLRTRFLGSLDLLTGQVGGASDGYGHGTHVTAKRVPITESRQRSRGTSSEAAMRSSIASISVDGTPIAVTGGEDRRDAPLLPGREHKGGKR